MRDNDDDQPLFDGPSKSARKREMHALQAIGERLVELPAAQLARMPIDDDALAEAIRLARQITARSGRRRQLQFIGKLMRHIDPTPIEAALAELDGQQQAANARFHQLEQLRDILLAGGDSALPDLFNRYPDADRSHLRQLLRQHQKSLADSKPSTVPKVLFRYLRTLDEAQ